MWWACVIAADASIPDNPSGPNQTATADKANLSNASCDSVVLDRTPPVAAINASATSVKVGDLLTFQASASDATSGLVGPGEWTFGDSDAIPSGDVVTHVYEQPGTYEVTLTVRDKAGNSTTVRKTITVSETPPPGDDDPDDYLTPPGEVHRLRVDAPRQARARAEFIPVQLTATDRGKVQLQLLDGEKVLARATVRLDPDGTADHRLKLKRGTDPGRYVLKATWKPARSEAITKLRNIRLVKSPPVQRRASAQSSAASPWAPGRARCPTGPSTAPAPRASSTCAEADHEGGGRKPPPSGASGPSPDLSARMTSRGRATRRDLERHRGDRPPPRDDPIGARRPGDPDQSCRTAVRSCRARDR